MRLTKTDILAGLQCHKQLFLLKNHPETRKPLLWLEREGNELYLVNTSGETLDNVIADTGEFVADDDYAHTLSSDSEYKYENVSDGDAVKVEEFDMFFDCDFVLQVYLTVQSAKLGKIEIKTPPEKGGIGMAVLLWDTGESGKNVIIKKSK